MRHRGCGCRFDMQVQGPLQSCIAKRALGMVHERKPSWRLRREPAHFDRTKLSAPRIALYPTVAGARGQDRNLTATGFRPAQGGQDHPQKAAVMRYGPAPGADLPLLREGVVPTQIEICIKDSKTNEWRLTASMVGAGNLRHNICQSVSWHSSSIYLRTRTGATSVFLSTRVGHLWDIYGTSLGGTSMGHHWVGHLWDIKLLWPAVCHDTISVSRVGHRVARSAPGRGLIRFRPWWNAQSDPTRTWSSPACRC